MSDPTPEQTRQRLASLTSERFTHLPQATSGSCQDGPTAGFLRQQALKAAAARCVVVDFPTNRAVAAPGRPWRAVS